MNTSYVYAGVTTASPETIIVIRLTTHGSAHP
jgi:hypothetical protein